MKFIPVLIALVSAALFGLSTPVSKMLLHDLSPFMLAGMLYLGAGITLMPFVIFKKKSITTKINRENIIRILGSVIFGGILGPVLLLLGLTYASASSVSLWLNMELIATAVLGHLFFKDSLNARGWIGAMGTLCAGILLTVNEGSTGLMAALFVTLGCICWGFDNHFTALIDGITPTQSTFIKGIMAGTVNLLIGYFTQMSLSSSDVIITAFVLGSFSYGFSIVLYITSAQNLGATRSQVVFSSAPFWGLFFSIMLLGEKISLMQIIATLILIGSIIILSSEKHGHKHEHSDVEHTHLHRHDDLHHSHEHVGQVNVLFHIHRHKHEKINHVHYHWPDLHHRHEHKTG